MKLLCEIVINQYFPAVRALIAKELMENYKLNQKDVAKRLRVSQPAVSYYLRNLRGSKVRIIKANKDLMDWIKYIAAKIFNNELDRFDVQLLCKKLNDANLLPKNFFKCKNCLI